VRDDMAQANRRPGLHEALAQPAKSFADLVLGDRAVTEHEPRCRRYVVREPRQFLHRDVEVGRAPRHLRILSTEAFRAMAATCRPAVDGTTRSSIGEYRRLSPTPDAFPILIGQIRQQEAEHYDQSDEAIRAIKDKTMIIVGDADGVQLDHALKLFELRGGGDRTAAAQGFLPVAPRARLAILPATSHIGIMANGPLTAELAIPFLDDTKPVVPPGFLK
jgi:hypothetical protein